MTRQILLTCIMLLGVVLAQAQTTATTSGGEASGSGGSASYSVGQVVYPRWREFVTRAAPLPREFFARYNE